MLSRYNYKIFITGKKFLQVLHHQWSIFLLPSDLQDGDKEIVFILLMEENEKSPIKNYTYTYTVHTYTWLIILHFEKKKTLDNDTPIYKNETTTDDAAPDFTSN